MDASDPNLEEDLPDPSQDPEELAHQSHEAIERVRKQAASLKDFLEGGEETDPETE